MSDIGPLLAARTTVASDVVLVRNGITRSQQLEVAAVCRELHGHCDLVVLAVPPGEGIAVQHRLLKFLRVEDSPASPDGPRETQKEGHVSAP